VHSSEYLKFIDGAAVPAQSSELQTGVPASITIAQAILESAWGKHHIDSANNYFGVKAQENKKGNVSYGSIATGYVDTKTREHIAGNDITITAHFRSYKDMTDSLTDHGMFLK
jgi:flagellum-specific peptidoglycan hydrolase FlgJ